MKKSINDLICLIIVALFAAFIAESFAIMDRIVTLSLSVRETSKVLFDYTVLVIVLFGFAFAIWLYRCWLDNVYIAMHDKLTGLKNHACFKCEVKRLLDSPPDSVGIIVCDVDGLKLINDTLGYIIGDRILFAAAKILKARCTDCLVFRMGGDEFLVLVPDRKQDAVDQLCKNIKLDLALYNTGAIDSYVSLSTGSACGDLRTITLNHLYREAVSNMYLDKLYQSSTIRTAIIKTLMKSLTARELISESQTMRLQEIVGTISESMDLSEERISDLNLLAQFHDIGRIGIYDRLQPFDTAIPVDSRHRHSEIGYRIAMSSPELAPIADWILKHHEWWNGNGYPLGLKGEEIPLECRILAVAEAYCKATAESPYGNSLSHEETVEMLWAEAGTQFDPEVVRVLMDKLANQ